MHRKVEITFGSVEMVCHGSYSSAMLGTLESPPEPAEFTVQSIDVNGADIFLLMEYCDKLDEIEQECLTQIHENYGT